MRNKWYSLLSLAALLACLLTGARAEDKGAKTLEKPSEDKAPEGKITPSAQAALDLGLAYQLAHYGRETQDVDALLLAARLIARADVTVGLKADKGIKPDAKTAEGLKGAKVEDKTTAAALVAEAGKLAESERHKELVREVRKEVAERKRGEIDGPQTNYGNLAPYGVATWNSTFVAGQMAVVSVGGTGGIPVGYAGPGRRPVRMTAPAGGFSVTVINPEGRVVTSSSGPYVTCRWYPDATKTYTIQIRDLSGAGGPYRLNNN